MFTHIDAPFIYEFDLKGFFDNVDLDFINKTLRGSLGMPEETCRFFRDLNRSIVKLTSEDLVPEPDRLIGFGANLAPNPNDRGCPSPLIVFGTEAYVTPVNPGIVQTSEWTIPG